MLNVNDFDPEDSILLPFTPMADNYKSMHWIHPYYSKSLLALLFIWADYKIQIAKQNLGLINIGSLNEYV
jgi:hypothetical protein